MPYFSIVNEPGYERSGIWSGEWLRDVIKVLGPRMRADGFPTMIVTPDDVRSTDGAARAEVILADPAARAYVGALAFHLYDEPVSNVAKMKMLSDAYGIPLWMTEYSMPTGLEWAVLVNDLISQYNVSAVDSLFSFGNSPTAYVRFRNSGTTYTGYELTKHYYMTGQYSRFVKQGARRVRAASPDASLRVSAFTRGGDLVIVAINTGANRSVRFEASSKGCLVEVQAVRTDQGSEDWRPLPAPVPSGSAFVAPLSGNSVTTFVAR